jgi:glucose-1-phosphate thymidylyltransferase
MKGIVLAGGNGTRLYPLTRVISKQLLPVFDKPMIHYPLGTLKQMGITEVAIIVKPADDMMFFKQLGGGKEYGMEFTYIEQPSPDGIPQAFILAEQFIGDDDVVLILGDNVFIADPSEFDIHTPVQIWGYKVQEPQRYGVIANNGVIIEKPDHYVSDRACVGLYKFDNSCVERSKKLQKSTRGELEIADLINSYTEGKGIVSLSDGCAWFDCGTIDDLLECSNFVKALSNRTNIKLGI